MRSPREAVARYAGWETRSLLFGEDIVQKAFAYFRMQMPPSQLTLDESTLRNTAIFMFQIEHLVEIEGSYVIFKTTEAMEDFKRDWADEHN